jgi:type II secretory pathway predicted ATPase ExeA
MNPHVLSELRLLSSMHFDAKIVLTVILAGDQRLTDKFRTPELMPLGSRIRARLNCEPYSHEQLLELLKESLARAGAPNLMTKELLSTLVEHSAGNPRVMNILAGEILLLGMKKEAVVLDEALFFETLPSKKRA